MFGNWHLPRRTLLRGAGAAVSLPLLDVMQGPTTRAAETTRATSRLAYLYIPNGVAEGAWQPEKTDSDGRLVRLNQWMSSLASFRNDLTIFRNLWTPRGNGHIAGTATWLTGGAFDGVRLNAGGASVDQIAARHFRNQTMLPSLELSVRGEGFFTNSLARNTISWVDDTTPAPRDIEPRAVFDRMFRSGRSGLGSRSVLHLVLEDARRLKRLVSDDDQKKIDEYLQSVRTVEQQIARVTKRQAEIDRLKLTEALHPNACVAHGGGIEAAPLHAPAFFLRDQPGGDQNADMFGDRGKRHLERLGDVGDSHVVFQQHHADLPTGRVREGCKDGVERIRHKAPLLLITGIVNQMVQ